MASFMDLSKNYSFYSIPLAYLLAMLPGAYAKGLGSKHYDIANPRGFQEQIKKDDGIDKVTKNRILRGEAASANATETISFFVAGVVAANYGGVPVGTTNLLCATYLASRTLYNVVYVWLQDNRKLAPLRSVMFNIGVISWMTMFIKAGNRLYEASS
ncbi:hypothetical protein F5Y15DRAFT_420194 [Xylariaceae sp. FL0016]|nr:hypothetical protein F5Y15DRAFT_420194 [Xylariaceae sp. FL0016]